MSRSYRKNDFSGITTARTERHDKRQAHHTLRGNFRKSLTGARDNDALEALYFDEHNRAHSDAYNFAKDGKTRLGLRYSRYRRRLVAHGPQPLFIDTPRALHKALGK